MDHNPFLKPALGESRGGVENPFNLEWQTRAAPPTEFENRLGDALETIFAGGAQELAEVVAGLNGMQLFDAEGRPWTEASFQEILKRLGA